MNRENLINSAAKLLKITVDEASKYCHEIVGLNALYFSVPVKGGDSLIIDENNDVLYANSSISYEEHIQAYKSGKRTPIEAFET